MKQTFPGLDASLVGEQEFFDTARATREDARERRANAWRSAGNSKDRSRLKANADTDETLGSPGDAVAFLRLDTEDGECLYVGDHAISDERTDLLVHSWKAPAILRLRGATHEETRGVVRRRTYSTEPINTIADLDDLFFAELARQVAQLGATAPQLLESDDFLQTVLSRGRAPEMQTIVQTIQAAQNDVIAAPPDQLLLIQGGPGTGKTAIALHRVAALLYGPLRQTPGSEVLVVGPNPTFLRYIARVLPELSEENVRHLDIGRLMSSAVTVDVVERPEAAKLKGDSRMVEVVARALTDRVRAPSEPLDLGLDGVSWRVSLEPAEVEQMLEVIDRLPYANGRVRFRGAVEQKMLGEAHKRLRRDRWSGSLDQLKLRPQEVDALIERIWPQLSPQAFLRDLYGSVERLLAAAGATLSAEEVQLLRRQAAPRLSEQLWSKEDLPLLDQVAWEMSGEGEAFAHIVVDEAQDLSPMQLLALRRRSANGAMTIVGDIAQSTGHWARSTWDDLLEELASPLPQAMVQPEFGYRVPRGVMDVAAKLLPFTAPGIEPPTVIRDIERAPQWHEMPPGEDRFARVIQVVREHSSNGLFVGVICPDSGRHALEEAFRAVGTQWNDADKGGLTSAINVVSPGASKGLEFDAVVVVDPQAIVDAGPHGLRMLYIALTRTTGYLDVVFEAGTLPVPLLGATPAVNRTATHDEPSSGASEAPGASPVDRPDDSGREQASTAFARRPAQQEGRPSTRRKVIAFHADGVLELLRDVAPPHLWHEILAEAISQAGTADGAGPLTSAEGR